MEPSSHARSILCGPSPLVPAQAGTQLDPRWSLPPTAIGGGGERSKPGAHQKLFPSKVPHGNTPLQKAWLADRIDAAASLRRQ